MFGACVAPLASIQAAIPHFHSAPVIQLKALPPRPAYRHTLPALLTAQHIAKALHQAHLAQKVRLASVQGRKAAAASATLRHVRKMALLKSALQQQRLAVAEVKMQRALTAHAKLMALRQQKMAQVQRKAQIKLAALRHRSFLRLAKLQSQHQALGSGNVVMAAYALRGSRYVMGGTSRSGFDCSGFVRYVLSETDGVSIPRTAAEQYYHGTPIPVQKMEPGDLVFFKNTYKRGISHVGIYAGQGKFIHAANSHKGVRMDILNSPYYWHHFAGARRVLPSVMRQSAFLR